MKSTGIKTEVTQMAIAIFTLLAVFKKIEIPQEAQAAIIVLLTMAAGYFARLRATRCKNAEGGE